MRFEEEIALEQQRFLDRYDEAVAALRRVPGVLSVGVGARERRGEILPELAFRVYVAEKIPTSELPKENLVPRLVCGLPTDVIVKTEVDELAGTFDSTKFRPLQGGSQIRAEKFEGDNTRGMGTLGCLAQLADGSIVGLTAQHVSCAGTDFGVGAGAGSFACVGVKIGQPRHIVCCCCCTLNEIGAVLAAQKTAALDCATVKLDDDTASEVRDKGTLNQVVDIGALTGVAPAVALSEVRKRGAATQLTRGTVIDVAYEGSQILINPLPAFPKFAAPGDSGAVIVNAAGKVVGLLWGADRTTRNRGVANHIAPVVAAMGITIAAVRIEIVRDHNNRHLVDDTSPIVEFVRVGLWDHAYAAAAPFDVRNGPAEIDNFVGSDTRRFYFRVTDPNNPAAEVQINWRTEGTNADAPAVASLTLRETAAGSHVYVSRAVMVVTMTEDRDFPTDSGLLAPAANLRAAGQSDHRTRLCAIDGSTVRGDYTPAGGGAAIFAVVPIFNRAPDERRRVNCRVINYGGNASAAHISAQFAFANQVWNQVGIQIDASPTVVRPVPPGALDGGGDYPGGADSVQEQAAMADLLPVAVTPDATLTVVFVRLSGGNNAYTTVVQRMLSVLGDRTFIFLSHNVADLNFTLAHELHHTLFNRLDNGVDQPFISFNTNPSDSYGIPLPDVRVRHRFQNLNSPDPDNDPTNANVLNWARRIRTARFPLPAALDPPDATTGNIFAVPF